MPNDRRQLRSFAPDGDPLAKDSALADNGFYPVVKGYKVMPGMVAITPPLPSQSLGNFVGSLGSGGPFIVAGTDRDLFVLQAGQWVAQNLTLSSTLAFPDRWRFTQYGLDVVAVNDQDRPFVSRNGGPFRPMVENPVIHGLPPISSLTAATENALFLVQDDTNTWWSSLSDEDWTLSIATETISAQLVDPPGPIIAAWAIRGGIALYKKRGFSVAFFSGAPFFWNFQKVSDRIGPPCSEAVITAGDFHYFWGGDNFYRFDGFNLTPIQSKLREFFLQDFDRTFDYLMAGRWDEERSLVVWHYPSTTANPAGTIDSWICLNTQTGEWGNGKLTIEMPLQGFVTIAQGFTYDQFGMMEGFYDNIPDIPYDDPIFGATGPLLSGAFLGDHALYAFAGPPTNAFSTITSSDFGDQKSMYEVRRVRPGWTQNPGYGISQCEVYAQYLQGTPPQLVQVVPQSPDGNYNVHVTARLMRFLFRVFGPNLNLGGGGGGGGGGTGGITYDQFGVLMQFYDNIPGIPYDAPLFGGSGATPPGPTPPPPGTLFGDAEIEAYDVEYEYAGEV